MYNMQMISHLASRLEVLENDSLPVEHHAYFMRTGEGDETPADGSTCRSAGIMSSP